MNKRDKVCKKYCDSFKESYKRQKEIEDRLVEILIENNRKRHEDYGNHKTMKGIT